MSSITVTIADDRVIFDIHETKPDGICNEHRQEFVPFDSSRHLRCLPNTVRGSEYSQTDLYWVAQIGQWVGFNFSSYQERSTGPNEEDFDGPFLVVNQPPPTADELAKTQGSGCLPQRAISPYNSDGRKIDPAIAIVSIDEALQQKLPKMAHSHHRNATVINSRCPKCGSPVACVYDDLGAVDYYDNFGHVCLNGNCDFSLQHEEKTLSVGGRQDPAANFCCFCQREIQMTF